MKFLSFFVFIFTLVNGENVCKNKDITNSCITFTVGSGTGCAWMCDYCATNLGTNNYYFTDNICTYKEGQGCVGNPVSGKSYTCCSN